VPVSGARVSVQPVSPSHSTSHSTSHPLAGRTALVTGASRGIGQATALALSAAGAQVVLVARGAEALSAAAAACGPRAVACAGDVSTPEGAAAIVDEVLRRLSAPPDLLINNAGMFSLSPVHETSAADFADTVTVNLIAPFRLLRAFLPAWRTRGAGHVVTVGSVADRHPFPENGAYAASKYGARALHEVVRAETHGTGVRCTLVSPGPVDTPLWDPVQPETREGFPARDAMLRASDVADAIVFAVTRPAHVNVDELRLGRA
jgi:NADP-dependent 3-hydroxy acid dehydrogenase YdfG